MGSDHMKSIAPEINLDFVKMINEPSSPYAAAY
jgi:hypothetical protein